MADVVKQSGNAVTAFPKVRAVSFADLTWALEAGVADFRKAPAIGLFFGGIYALGGLLILATVFALDVGYLAYPLAAGSVLIGPFVAAGLYEVSREIEAGR